MLPDIPDNLLAGQADPTPYFAALLEHFLGEAAAGRLRVRIPPLSRRPLDGVPHTAVHHEPELFFQVHGVTDFTTPGERLRLMPGQLCVIPPLVAHGERAFRWSGKPFANVVAMMHRDWLRLHVATAAPNRSPTARDGHDYTIERFPAIRHCLTEAIDARFSTTPGAAARCNGSMMTALGHLRDSLDKRLPPAANEHPKVSRCRNIAMTHLSNPDLNVQELARRVGCSADYLSNLFHREAGIRLTAWLNDQRIQRVKELLCDSSLNISEIAWATGYRDPGYLARRFRTATGLSPREFRRQHNPSDKA